MDIEETYKKDCKCSNCGYKVRIFPDLDCINCDNGKMIELKNCICHLCNQVEFIIPGKNCEKCKAGKMIELKFCKN